MGYSRPQHARHQHRRRHRVLLRCVDPVGGLAVRRCVRATRPESARHVSEPVTTDTATTAKSGVDVTAFASRRTLVMRRFLRNKPAVISLILLVLLFVGCYALPPLLP